MNWTQMRNAQVRNFRMKSCKKELIPSNDYGIVGAYLKNEAVHGSHNRPRLLTFLACGFRGMWRK